MNWRRWIEPRMDAPFPVWMIFPVIFVALYASHITLLRLPYYWDEAGYYIPAAWDFFRTGSLIPISTLTNAHPPLPSVYLTLWWKASGFAPEVTREAVLVVASFGLLAVWQLAMRLVGILSIAFWTVVLTALYPVWFAQSSLAHADIFAACCVLWGFVHALPAQNRKPWLAALWFAAAALCKETAIIIPITFAAMSIYESLRANIAERAKLWREAVWYLSCVIPLCCWYAWHRLKTGFLFGNPEFLRYNAQANTEPLRMLLALGHRILHLTVHMNLFVPVLMAIAALMLVPKRDADKQIIPGINATVLRKIWILLAVNALVFSVLGGALLTRYLLPMYPLVLLMVVKTFHRRAPLWHALAVFSAIAFLAGLFINPPYGFAPEDNLQYARVIRLQMNGIEQLQKLYPNATVLSAWPVTDALAKPELGYVKKPFDVYSMDDFTAANISRAASVPERYSTALVFSTKYDPSSLFARIGVKNQLFEEKYFGLHHDLSPEIIANQLGGTLVWQRKDHDMWIALIRFNRQYEANVVAPEILKIY